MKRKKLISKQERIVRRWRAAESVARNKAKGGSARFAWQKVLESQNEREGQAFVWSLDWRDIAKEEVTQ